MTENRGLYIHIPFCRKKCAYCDFYSLLPLGDLKERYMAALYRQIAVWGEKAKRDKIDTVYIGGGTPSLLGGDIVTLLDTVRKNFALSENAEITAEANPEDTDFLPFAAAAGVNRLSIGAQTFNDGVLKVLGRNHTAKDTENFYFKARNSGFLNISLDIMLSLPGLDKAGARNDAEKLVALSPEHISAYILKREKNTKFSHFKTPLPSEDFAADNYEIACDIFENAGYSHYEISNFAKTGFESRHNLKYWQAREYIGIGAAAHGFFEGKRYFYPRDIKAFISGDAPIFDGMGGTREEKMMLSLRLKDGIDLLDFYGEVPPDIQNEVKNLIKHGLIAGEYPKIHLTDKGMLVSNSIITEICI